VKLDLEVFLETKERLEKLDLKDHEDNRELKENKEQPDLLDHEDHVEPPELKVYKEHKEMVASPEDQEPKVTKAPLEIPEVSDQRDLADLLVPLERRVKLESQVAPVELDTLVVMVNPDLKDSMVKMVTKDQLEHEVCLV